MTWTKEQTEQGSFPLARDERTLDELLEAGKYDWVADYARQIVHSASHSTGEQLEIILLAPPRSWPKDQAGATFAPAHIFNFYDAPDVRDALRFGADYPDEQLTSPILFPHERWLSPEREPFIIAGIGVPVRVQRQLFVLVLRADGQARGLSYAPPSVFNDWWPSARIAVRKRAERPKVADAQDRAERSEAPDAPW